MPAITFGGINTGLPPNLVDQMIEAEKLPIKNMQAQKGKSENRMKLVTEIETKINDIQGKIGELANSKGFTDIKLNSSDPNVINGTIDPSIAPNGSWTVEVDQLAQKASAITNGFPDRDSSQLGVGYFRFKTPDGDKSVYINGSNNTLEGAAKAINNSHLGVRAAIINDRKDTDNPFKLVISAEGVGAEKGIEYPTLYFLDGDQDLFFESKKEALNGLVKVDGFDFEIADNNLKDLIPGINLELKKASPGNPVTLSVKEDHEIIAGKVKGFVDSMNAVLQFIQAQNKLDKSSDTTQTLGGDGLLRTVENRLRQLIQNPQYGVKSPIKTLSEIGIRFTRAGILELDQKKFETTLGGNPDGVHGFLVGDGFNTGFVPSLKREIGNLLNSAFGPIANRKKGLQEKINDFDQRIEQKEKQLTKKEEQLREKFSRLEETMSRLKAQGSQVAALGGGGFAGPQLNQG